jgi:methanogenic corrinoid protein MtbC1
VSVTAADREAFLALVLARDTAGATAFAVRLADDGIPATDILVDLVGTVQAEVGERWYRDEASVADEHAATSIADAVVSVLAAGAPHPEADGPRVAVLCAEEEWHSLPARITAEVLRAAGCPVEFLGGSLPPSHLARFLASTPVDVVAISCSTAMSFEPVLAGTHVAHEAGVPVIVGGRAFGPDARRANALGADLWAPNARTGAQLVRDNLPTEPFAVPTADVAAAMRLAARRDELVDAAVAILAKSLPAYAKYTQAQRDRTREDLVFILRFAEAALLVDDDRIFAEFLAWLDVLLTERGLPAGTLAISLQMIAAGVPSDDPLLTLLTMPVHPG